MTYPFSSNLYRDEARCLEDALKRFSWRADFSEAVSKKAADLVSGIRAAKGKGGYLESFLQEFSLNTEEGLAMMCLAEALLRIPDAHTAGELIRDKVAAARWLEKQGGSKDWMTRAAGIGMALSRKTLESSLARFGEPFIREAMIKAMQMMGRQFVLGVSMDDAMKNAKSWESQGYRMSYDILGEAARDAETAERYYKAYAGAIQLLGDGQAGRKGVRKAGISVKLSALHPRYSYAQREACVPVMVERLRALAKKAANYGIPLTVDAEEAARLDLSISIFEAVFTSEDFAGWDGLGLAVQAYQKRALPLLDYLAELSSAAGRRIEVRVVKGAYWDSEIKRAQMEGFADYPVFTRKCNTDVSYLACAAKLFAHPDAFYPMLATHNAHSVSAIHAMAQEGGVKAYEFQRLHGMGEGLYAQVLERDMGSVSVYAPVGPHKDLLPYLVRRLLENGANSSFVNKLLDKDIAEKDLVKDPVAQAKAYEHKGHPSIVLPENLYGAARVNSAGLDLNDPASSQGCLDFIRTYSAPPVAHSLVSGKAFEEISEHFIGRAFEAAKAAYPAWDQCDVTERARMVRRFGDMLENNRDEMMAILVHEAGKSIPDALNEVREAVDFCRYYALQGETHYKKGGVPMSGYTGESNHLSLHGRGVFVCISPWNFPLAIFTGQIVAALMAGNTVIAKPASQTRAIAMRIVALLHEAGIPVDALHLLLGDGAFGGQIVAHPDVAGVVFTGSTATAKSIQRTLCDKDGAIVPFIAETGGQNAMIVDSSALPEQVVDDVMLSAFGSAGQRCSALRVVYVQEDIADDFLALLKGAMKGLVVGDPKYLSSDVGRIIDESACRGLKEHLAYLERIGARSVAQAGVLEDVQDDQRYFAPCAYEIDHIGQLRGEVFGPILHVIRYKAEDIEHVIEQINGTGFGLTFGVHSRITGKQEKLAERIRAGNIYVNRSMIGAIVGVQPFGGMGLSGTGPKAGGPHYLPAFGIEKHVSVNTTASGGNTSLAMLADE